MQPGTLEAFWSLFTASVVFLQEEMCINALIKKGPQTLTHTHRHHHCWSTVSLYDKEGVSVNICGEWNTCPTHGWQCNGKKLSLYCVPCHNLLFNKLTVHKLSRGVVVPCVATRCQCWVVEELQFCHVGSVFAHTGVRCVNHTLLLTLSSCLIVWRASLLYISAAGSQISSPLIWADSPMDSIFPSVY